MSTKIIFALTLLLIIITVEARNKIEFVDVNQTMEFHDFHVPQNKQKKIAFEGMQDAYSVDLELKYSTQEGAKSFCFPVVHHEEFKQHFSERFLRNEKAVSWTLIHETATVFLLTDEMNLYQFTMPEWAKVNHYFVFKGKTDLSSIRSAFTKDNENTTKIFIEYSKTLDNILLHYYDTQYRINTFAPYDVVPGTLRYGDSLKDVSLSLEYGNFWITTATYHRSDVVEIFDFTFPEDSASILQTPKVVLSRDEVLSIHKRKLEFDVPKEEDFDVQIKEEIPWFDYTNLEEGQEKYSWTTDGDWKVVDAFNLFSSQIIPATLTIMDMKIDQDKYLYVLYKEVGLIAFEINEQMTLPTLVRDKCISVQEGMKFAIYGNTVVIVTREESGPTLIELNYYKLDEEAAPRWHFNRAIDYLSDINKIIIDEKRAFLIGTNIHYIYKHSIYSDFIKDEELIFYEFVDRDMEDFDLLTGRFDELLGDVKISHFGYSFYYSFTGKGIDCYQLQHISPRIQCQTNIVDESTEVEFEKDAIFTYGVTFLQPTCDKLENLPKEEQFFKVCRINEEIRIVIDEQNIYDRKFASNWTAFKFGLLLGGCLICTIACICIGQYYYITKTDKHHQIQEI